MRAPKIDPLTHALSLTAELRAPVCLIIHLLALSSLPLFVRLLVLAFFRLFIPEASRLKNSFS